MSNEGLLPVNARSGDVPPPARILSAQEIVVLRLVALGRTSKEIAQTLGISAKTVNFHRANIMDKTGLRSIAELTRYAMREGLLLEDTTVSGDFQLTGRFEIVNSASGYEWLLRATDGSELIRVYGAVHKERLHDSIAMVRRFASLDNCYQRVVDGDHSPRFTLADLEGAILAVSGAYPSRLSMELAIQRCRECAPIAPVVEMVY